MQATELYELGKKAYNGNQQARKKWFQKVSLIAQTAGMTYQVCPSLILCKAAIESGWATDLYEEKTLEPKFGVKLQRKAQKHNNLIGMNAFKLNCNYLKGLPQTRWSQYQTVFYDYGPHIHNGQYVLTPNEPWKSFINIEDCFEDWAANMRFQADYHKKQWGLSLRQQLNAIESYTPQGAAAASKGMNFGWQDTILKLYKEFELYKYDKKVMEGIMSTNKVQITVKNLDQHIRKAYEYAHKYCTYGPTDRCDIPMEDGKADCVGLVLRAFYTMGYNNGRKNINQILKLCEDAGMVKSTDINDVWKYHGVVCMQDKVNAGSINVNHVYYSLGGTGINSISKYDLGSNERIKASQPYPNAQVNEWINTPNPRIFMCFYYIKETTTENKRPALPKFETTAWTKGEVKKRVGLYEGPGSTWKRIKILQIGTQVDFGPKISNAAGKLWRRVKTDKYDGYVYYSSVGTKVPFVAYATEVKDLGKNDFAALRVGPGTAFDKIDELKSGTEVRIGDSILNNNEKWSYVTVLNSKKRGYVASHLLN